MIQMVYLEDPIHTNFTSLLHLINQKCN